MCNSFVTGQTLSADMDTAAKRALSYSDKIYKKNIRSCMLDINGLELSNPVISLNGDNQLLLRFDDLSAEVRNYNYTVILCNADWTPAAINDFEYLTGFTEGNILDFAFSYSTLIPYVHYSLMLPNSDFSWNKSGNYLLLVYENNDREELVLTKRFIVTESMVSIEGVVKRPGFIDYTQSHQELQFEVTHQNVDIRNPFEEVSVTVLQNFRWDNAYIGLKPIFVNDYKLSYIQEGKLVFPGLKEFRYFDVRNLRWLSDRVKSFSRDTAYLVPDEMRTFANYSFRKDINGKMITGKYEALNNALEADYVYVHFTLQTNIPFLHGSVYVLGELSQWNVANNTRMTYNFQKKEYEADILLKQGYYNYYYAIVETGSNKIDASFFEGSSYETENDYEIIVYYRPTGERYDRVIAYKEMNWLKK